MTRSCPRQAGVASDEHFRPKIVAAFNDHKLELVKVKGEFVSHSHLDRRARDVEAQR
jgi:hypothetical protein